MISGVCVCVWLVCVRTKFEAAPRLSPGSSVVPRCVEEVTMLFSDLVGFTAICSSATPLQVVSMLQALYTEFDASCGQLDVYKVRVCVRVCACVCFLRVHVCFSLLCVRTCICVPCVSVCVHMCVRVCVRLRV